MAVPKRRSPNSKQGMRRSHHAKVAARLTHCPRCQDLVPQHVACPGCGTYKGRGVINVTKKLDRQTRKKKEQNQQK